MLRWLRQGVPLFLGAWDGRSLLSGLSNILDYLLELDGYRPLFFPSHHSKDLDEPFVDMVAIDEVDLISIFVECILYGLRCLLSLNGEIFVPRIMDGRSTGFLDLSISL